MTALAKETQVRFVEGSGGPELLKSPVFRYDDQQRNILDATLWVWIDQGRPIAFEKIEAIQRGGGPRWSHCFTSLCVDRLAVEWSADRKFETSESGVVFQAIAKSPAVDPRSAQRKRQARELAREFSARLENPDASTAQMRLLATPIFEYADPKTMDFQGAVFGFAATGTNPDLLLILEARREQGTPRWQFAPARITAAGIILAHHDKTVWTTPVARTLKGPFTNWICFGTPRAVPPPEDQP